ncbi:hypothetical protein GCM10023183_14420 [Nibribacter koreensis]|uniref:Uncharacterized protein n=1 Tax=Nibribacter koreensis TaxID=1084519 RepID=A0ABP8FG74_9BACT
MLHAKDKAALGLYLLSNAYPLILTFSLREKGLGSLRFWPVFQKISQKRNSRLFIRSITQYSKLKTQDSKLFHPFAGHVEVGVNG